MNQLIAANITMTSLEMVEFINSQRGPGEATLTHADFLKKVPRVLGVEHAGNFSAKSSVSIGNGATRMSPMYRFPKREACLMAMSYSYELQAKVFDKMTALEEAVAKNGQQFYVPQTRAEALRLAADLEEKNALLEARGEEQSETINELAPKADALGRIASLYENLTMQAGIIEELAMHAEFFHDSCCYHK